MTENTFRELGKRMTLVLRDDQIRMSRQLATAKNHYRMACDDYGVSSPEAGIWDSIVCGLQGAIESLKTIREA